jgi:tetratricopeptide (TPR) repeat protein
MRTFVKNLAIVVSLAAILSAHAQSKTRTRIIDYTEYDQLIASIYSTPDKAQSIHRLLDIINKNFSPEDEEYFRAHYTLGMTYELMLLDLTAALHHYQLALDAYENHYPFYTRGYSMITQEIPLNTYISLAKVYRTLNLFDKAVKLLEIKEKTILENPSPYLQQQYYTDYGLALLGLEDYQKAISIGSKLKDMVESGTIKTNFPSADEIYKIDSSQPVTVQEQLKKAKEQYIQSMRISEESALALNRMNYNMVLAYAYYNQFQFAEATPYLKNMIESLKKVMTLSAEAMKLSQSFSPNTNTGAIKKQGDELQDYMTKCELVSGNAAMFIIAAFKSNQSSIAKEHVQGLVDKAVYSQMAMQFKEAEEYWQAAFKLLKEFAQYNFASVAGEQMLNGYMPFYINALVQAGKLETAYQESLKILTREENSLRKNFQFFSEGEKKEFFKGYNQKLEKHLSILFLMTENKNDHSEEILNKILQSKGLILEVTREQEKRLKKSGDKTIRAEIQNIRKLRDKLAAFYQINQKNPTTAITDSINRYSIKINEMERGINEKLGAASDVLKPVNWKDLRAKLKRDEIYLEIVRIKRDPFTFDKPVVQYWGFAIKPDASQPVLFKISEGEAFDERGLKNYQNRMRSQLDDPHSYKTYWASIHENISGAKKIFFSSDGVYHMINPLTLKNPETEKFVLNEIQLMRVSTGRDLLAVSGKILPVNQITLIGNPEFDMNRKGTSNAYLGNEIDALEVAPVTTRGGFTRLPGTQLEVESIQAMAVSQGIKTTVLSGHHANESKVKSVDNPTMLHVATHGEFDQRSVADSYLKSKLILAGAGDSAPFTLSDYSQFEDGFLTAYEVTQLELSRTTLVVLSACETGLGEIQSGEGVWGLQRAFQLAGAKTVMGSLWKISDEATVTFMKAFYQEYFRSSEINIAYQKAMETTMTNYPHPYFWGAFTLTGIN